MMLGSEFFIQQTSKPNLIKLMDRLNTLPRSLKDSLRKTLSGKLYFGDGQWFCFFNVNKEVQVTILKEPLLLQKQMILHNKGLILSFLESLRAWHYQESIVPTCLP